MDDEPADDTAPLVWAPVGDPPGHLPLDWLDYGDAEQLVEMSAPAEPPSGEPVEMVDAPLGADPPDDRPGRRRPLPT
ncbi:hypothetical protein GCM10017556_20010 [Micromonospora sagamiensis]|nr:MULTISPECIES: hypothetical protein [Micromonospora]BCL14262.1 hypothetical protein GCM10017556_20010 [Micromonospora sagamiensis]